MADLWLVVTAVIVCGIAYVLYYMQPIYVKGVTVVPSIPVFGAVIEYFPHAQKGHTHKWFYDLMVNNCGNDDFVQVNMLGTVILCSKDPEFCREILRTASGDGLVRRSRELVEVFKPFSNGLLILEGDVWRAHRRMVLPAFNTARLKQVCAVSSEVAKLMIARYQALDQLGKLKAQPVDMTKELLNGSLQVLLKSMFGLDEDILNKPVDENYDRKLDLIVLGMEPRATLPKPLWRFLPDEKLWRASIQMVRDDIVEKLRARADSTAETDDEEKDILSLLIRAAQRESMTEEEIVDEALMFFGAGHETSATTATWALYMLAQRPDVQARIRDQMDEVLGKNFDDIPYEKLDRLTVLDAAVKESMRLKPTVIFVSRRIAEKGLKWKNLYVPPETELICDFQAMMRDPKHWEDPDEYLPDRWLADGFKPTPGTYIPFSAGPQGCIGERLAKLEVRVIVAKLLQSYEFSLAKKASEYETITSLTTGLKKGCPLYLRPVENK
eukprot:Clim_evm18s229 gene=Clim_evmTU18s229